MGERFPPVGVVLGHIGEAGVVEHTSSGVESMAYDTAEQGQVDMVTKPTYH